MSNYKPLYPSLRTCRSETEISNLFERHMNALLAQKQKMINEITEWENNIIRQIQENVDKQKALLEQECNKQLHYLRTKRQEFLDTASIYEERMDREEVRLLLEQCHALTFELGSFDYPEQPIPFIQIQKNKQPIEKKNDSSHTYKFEKNLTINDDFRINDNKNAYASTSANSSQIDQQLITTSSIDNARRFITDNKNQNSDLMHNDDMVERCPACFMIFPLTMETHERSQHVNQHFGDN